jgi:signal transduction histidine kinase
VTTKRLADVRISTKLALILLVPAVAVLGLGGYLLLAAGQQAARASQALALTDLAGRAGDLAFALQLERAAAAILLLPDAGSRRLDAYEDRVVEANSVLARFALVRADVRSGPADATQAETAATLARVDAGVAGLTALRDFVTTGKSATWSAVVLRYRLLIADLLALRSAPALAGLPVELADQVRAASALSEAVEYVGLQHVAVLRAAASRRLSPAGLRAIVTADTGFQETRRAFSGLAAPAWRSWWDTTVTGEAVVTSARLEGIVAQARLDGPVDVEVERWTAATVARMGLMHSVQSRVDTEVLEAVRGERERQVSTAAVAAGLVLFVLGTAVAVAARVARSMARRLRTLRDGARYVAHQELPQVVSRMAKPRGLVGMSAQQVVETAVIPVSVEGRDEIGEVARAFVDVSREAVRHAADQALLRAHVGEMFVATARRLQTLSDKMTRQLDGMERDEADEQRLADLFALDHVGTRIGRYTDSLLVVSGIASARRRASPIDLLDVLRAAVGKVEQYQRVRIGVVDEGVSVAPAVVDDVVHALAELVDNACAFSPPDQPVVVEGRRIGADTLVEVTDRGIGIAPGTLAELNQRLAAAPQMDVRSLRSLGIASVAAIAAWHGLRVRLAPGDGGGITSQMLLPPEVTIRAPRHLHPADRPPQLWAIVPRLLERGSAMLSRVPASRTPPEPARAPSAHLPEVAQRPEVGYGWSAARAANPIPAGGVGLPVRTPMAQLVPGAIPTGDTGGPTSRTRDAATVAASMRRYQLGLMQGRAGGQPHAGRLGTVYPSTTTSTGGTR